jgi:Peptidase C13 family
MIAILGLSSLLLAAPIGRAIECLQAATPYVLIVTGIGGEPKYTQEFSAQARTILDGLARFRVPPNRIVWLAEPAAPPAAGRSTRERVEQELGRIATSAGPSDPVLIVFIGHGSDQSEPRFNLPGPDLAASDLSRLLAGMGDRSVAIVIAASASGGFVDRLAGPNRLVMTATKSGMERNESRFGHWLAQAFAGGAADIDKDGAMSLLEAFSYAVTEVRREYESTNRLLTEHARLSDSTLARRFVLSGVGEQTASDPATKALLDRKRDLENKIEQLRGRKAQMDSTAYERELETLLLELARVNQQLKAKP